LGQDLKKDAMVLMRSIYRANKAQSKKEYLETFLDDFELLKLEGNMGDHVGVVNKPLTKALLESGAFCLWDDG